MKRRKGRKKKHSKKKSKGTFHEFKKPGNYSRYKH